jgi:glycosyltransferase involved in cell wall biosynthesis
MKAKDEKEFKEKLKVLIEDETLRNMLVKNASKTVKEHSMDKVGKQLKKVYQEVLDEY